MHHFLMMRGLTKVGVGLREGGSERQESRGRREGEEGRREGEEGRWEGKRNGGGWNEGEGRGNEGEEDTGRRRVRKKKGRERGKEEVMARQMAKSLIAAHYEHVYYKKSVPLRINQPLAVVLLSADQEFCF